MRPFLIAVFAVLLVASAGAVSAAETPAETPAGPDNMTERAGADLSFKGECPAPEPIDRNTALCSAEVNDGVAKIVVKSDRLQRIQLTDAGAFMKGGVVPRTKLTLRPGEVQTIRWSVTEHRGFMGVSIETTSVLYAVPLDEPTTLVGGPWSAGDVQIAALSGAGSIAVMSIIIVMRAVTGRAESPKRLA